jgi:ubiquinol-cytochrome c reductase cytochrome c subunit
VTFLLARRRSPWMTTLLLLAALFVVGGGYAIVGSLTDAHAQGVTADSSTQIAQGKQLFLEGCSSCHGLHAEGAYQPGGQIAGPSLLGVGAAAVDFQVSTGRMPLANPEAQATRKEPSYNPDEVAALAAFVASLAPGPAIPTPDMYDTSGLTPEELAVGGELFRANCASCHSFSGNGGALTDGKYAPSLHDTTPQHMYSAMITGPQSMPVFPDSTLRPQDKREIIGYIETLRAEPNQGGIDLGRMGPVTEGLLLFVLGLGSLICVAVWIGVKAK